MDDELYQLLKQSVGYESWTDKRIDNSLLSYVYKLVFNRELNISCPSCYQDGYYELKIILKKMEKTGKHIKGVENYTLKKPIDAYVAEVGAVNESNLSDELIEWVEKKDKKLFNEYFEKVNLPKDRASGSNLPKEDTQAETKKTQKTSPDLIMVPEVLTTNKGKSDTK